MPDLDDQNFVQKDALGSIPTAGTYSGADIRIVVHLPVNPNAIKMELKKIEIQEQELDDMIKQAEYYHAKSFSANEPVVNIDSTYARLQYLNDRKKYLADSRAELMKLANKDASTLTKTLATLQTFSWSIFRGKSAVKFLGTTYPRGFVRGPRTIAGSMIFTMFNKHALQDILDWGLNPYSTGHVEADHDYYADSTMLIDQLPPLDITILFANEYGYSSYMNLWGVEFQSEGGTYSIEDLFSESVIQYVARDIDPIRESVQRKLDTYTNALTGNIRPKTASQLRAEDLDLPNTAVIKRRNPYI